jgi:hypothetical protein
MYLLAACHLYHGEDDRCVGSGLLLQELDEGLGYGRVDLGRVSLVAGVSSAPATHTHTWVDDDDYWLAI